MTKISLKKNILDIQNLNQYFRDFTSISKIRFNRFLTDINLSVHDGEVLGIVGESGCGKTTLGRCIVGLINTVTGDILYNGVNISHTNNRKLSVDRKKIQMIFQNPRSSLNINLTVKELISEAVQLVVKDINIVQERVDLLLSKMQLEGREQQYPYELSGGERRRVGFARIMAVEPQIIVADEPVSSLDVSIKRFIVDLLLDYKKENDATVLFITHDIELVHKICDRIIVMFGGRILELFSPKNNIEINKHHPYTQKLIKVTHFFSNEDAQIHDDDMTVNIIHQSTKNDKTGCIYYSQCILKDFKRISHICEKEHPNFIQIIKDHHEVACHAFSNEN